MPLFLLFIFLCARLSLASQPTTPPLIFPPSAQLITGGFAHSQPSATILCTPVAPSWDCHFQALFADFFFRIHHLHIACPPAGHCTLDFHLDFSPLAFFACALVTALAVGLVLVAGLYVAVRYVCSATGETDKCHAARKAEEEDGRNAEVGTEYGTFGRKVDGVYAAFDGSFGSLVELEDHAASGGEEVQVEELMRREHRDRLADLHTELWIG